VSWKRSLWSEWQIEDEIGAGSYGKVYRIRRQDIGGTFYAALKVISIPRTAEEVQSLRNAKMNDKQIVDYYYRFAQKMAREFAVMERLKGHTNIVSYEDHKIVPHDNGIGVDVLIRMELLTPMSKVLVNSECSESEAIKVGLDLCNALMVCEREKILHRDIKPGNVFVSNHGDYKLGDFSIARIDDNNLTAGSPQGTYAYMAPEIYAGGAYDKTIDLYSLGLILYRLLNNGRAPFLPPPPTPLTPNLLEEANRRRLQGDPLPAPANSSMKMTKIILKACAYLNKERYQSAKELYDDLRSCGELSSEQEADAGAPMGVFFTSAGDL